MNRPNPFTLAALVAALGSAIGSLYLSLGLKLIACPLCFYQRTFAFSILGILLVSYATRVRTMGVSNVLAYVPTVAGGIVAAWHTYLDMSGKLICPKGLFDLGSTAQQSLASYVLIFVCLVPGLILDVRRGQLAIPAVGWTTLLGAIFAYFCIVASPPPSQPKPELRSRICYPPILIEEARPQGE